MLKSFKEKVDNEQKQMDKKYKKKNQTLEMKMQ